MNASLLRLDLVSAGYGDVPVLYDVSLVVDPGSVTALIGGNGAGKTTIMRVISGLLPSSRCAVAAGDDDADVNSAKFHIPGPDLSSRPGRIKKADCCFRQGTGGDQWQIL